MVKYNEVFYLLFMFFDKSFKGNKVGTIEGITALPVINK
jgi:hypothetical protein